MRKELVMSHSTPYFSIIVGNRLRLPPFDWTCRKRRSHLADGEDDGNSRFCLSVGVSIVAFPAEPVKGKHLRCGWVLLPRALIPRTVGAATFKDVCDYMSASFNVKRAKILLWKYSLIFELTTPCDKGFDLWFWAYTALFEVTTPLYRDHMSKVYSSNGCGNPFFLVYAQFHFLKILSMDVLT